MPVIRYPNSPPPPVRDRLVARLADELAVAEATGREPIILENPIGQTGKFFAVVIWSEWGSVPWSQRTGVIADAYRRHDELHPDAPRAPSLAISSGLTWDEADANALFPFAVAPNARPEEADPERVKELMLAEGGVPTPAGVKLRFVTQEEATRAWERLHQRLPEAHWSINRYVTQVQDR